MNKQSNSRSGFVIKLSEETVQKLTEEEQHAKENVVRNVSQITESKKDVTIVGKSELEANSNNKDDDPSLQEKPSIPNEVKTVTSQSIDDCKESSNSHNVGSKDDAAKRPTQTKDDSNTSWGEYAPYVTYEDNEAVYTDPSTGQKYTWNKTSNSWDTKTVEVPGRVYSYEDDTHIYTESDGSKYFWDTDKNAWIPKVDDEFLAYYQMSYGFIDNKTENKKEEVEKKEDTKNVDSGGVKRKSMPQWFEQSDENNTKVYVSNLPLELDEEEFVNLMQKCGLVERDPSSQKMKIRLYMDKERNCFKGDALCTYIKIESVDLALKLLDGSNYKGNTIKVERAQFQQKGEYNPALKPKKKKKKELEKIKKMQQKLFDWRPEKFIGERAKHEKVVIVKNLFSPSDFDKEVQLILDYQQDLREECTKCGEVRKVVIYDGHPEGVAQINMKEPEQADAVVQLINGRWFGKRQITAEIWDGRTKYRIAETDADINKRIDKWDKFLEENVEKNEKSTQSNKDPVIKKENESKTEEIKCK